MDRIIQWPDGRQVRFELALDITERKRAEESLRALEAEISGIYTAAPVGIGVVSYPGRVILRVNPRVCEMLGYREEELLGRNARVLYADEEEFSRVGLEKYTRIGEKGIGSVETRWVGKDGRMLDVLLSYLPPRLPFLPPPAGQGQGEDGGMPGSLPR
jgi:PAS domain S-box-containing protein